MFLIARKSFASMAFRWPLLPRSSNIIISRITNATAVRPWTQQNFSFCMTPVLSSRRLGVGISHAVTSKQLHFSGTAPSSSIQHEHNSKGEELYNLAMKALKKPEQAKRSHEEKLLLEQYDAMEKQRKRKLQREKSREANPVTEMEGSRDRAAGVAVVRTIVKQSQPKAVQVEQHSNNKQSVDEQDEEYWQGVARQHMEEAACKYGHPLALVRLGNDALERAIEQSTESTVPFVDEERCKVWIYESPINLQQLLVLYSNCKDGTSDLVEENMHRAKYLSPYQQLAAYLYEEAGKHGSPEGYYNLGHLLWDMKEKEDGINNTLGDEAFEAFYKSMLLGDADAIYFLAVQYLSHDVEDTSATSRELTKLCKIKDMTASKEVQAPSLDIPTLELESDLHQTGYQLLRQAALYHEHGPAMHHLALLHQQITNNDDEFSKILSRAAALCHPESLFLQGHCFYHGSDGYEQDLKRAFDNFLAAAEHGHVDSLVSAGAMLHSGVRSEDGKSFIIERDQQRAFDLYQEAGELGSVEGWRNVVHCYATGQGVPKCLESAKHIAQTMLREDNS